MNRAQALEKILYDMDHNSEAVSDMIREVHDRLAKAREEGRVSSSSHASKRCEHPKAKVHYEDWDPELAATMSPEEVRERWPRGHMQCPDCGMYVISYADAQHYILGDW